MAKAKDPIPEGFRTITPHMTVKNAAEAIEFYKKAFGAEEVLRLPGPGGIIMHAELKIGDSLLMLNDEFPDHGKVGPQSLGGTPITVHLYVPDVDAVIDRAAKAGAKVTLPVADQFWGDRYGQVEDPYGHHWGVGTHVEDLTPEEIGERAQKAFG
jgi:PhnB protein